MKKIAVAMLFATIISCQSDKKENNEVESIQIPDTMKTVDVEPIKPILKTHSNDIFKDVTVKPTGNNTYNVKGKARVFEATINWSVEDGHFILADGFTTADIGAPEWGNFDFNVTVKPVDVSSSLILILFETSAKDGTHLHELTIKLK